MENVDRILHVIWDEEERMHSMSSAVYLEQCATTPKEV